MYKSLLGKIFFLQSIKRLLLSSLQRAYLYRIRTLDILCDRYVLRRSLSKQPMLEPLPRREFF